MHQHASTEKVTEPHMQALQQLLIPSPLQTNEGLPPSREYKMLVSTWVNWDTSAMDTIILLYGNIDSLLHGELLNSLLWNDPHVLDNLSRSSRFVHNAL